MFEQELCRAKKTGVALHRMKTTDQADQKSAFGHTKLGAHAQARLFRGGEQPCVKPVGDDEGFLSAVSDGSVLGRSCARVIENPRWLFREPRAHLDGEGRAALLILEGVERLSYVPQDT